jgi:zinc protease
MKNDIVIRNYENGFRSVVCPMDGFRTVSTSVLFGAGSANEREAEHGISHMLEHTMFCGDNGKELRNFGADSNAETNYDYTTYQAFGIGAATEKSNEYLSNLVFKNKMTKKYFEDEKKVVTQEIEEALYDALADSTYLSNNHHFRGTAYSHEILGTKRHIQNFTINNLRDYKKQNYCADNMILGICGNISPQTAQRIIEKYWLPYLPSLSQEAPIPKKENFNPEPSYIHKNNRSMTQHDATITIPLPVRTSTNAEDFDVMKLLTANRLFTACRDKKKLVYGICTSIENMKIASVMNVNFKTTPDNTARVFETVASEMKKLRAGKFTKDEISTAQRMATYVEYRKYEELAENSNRLVEKLSREGEVLTVDEKVKRINKVNFNKICLAAKSLEPQQSTVGIVGPGASGLNPFEYMN